MYKPYVKPVSAALPDVNVHEPRISKLVLFVLRMLSGLYIYFLFGVKKMVVRNGRSFFEAYQRALEGKSRCIIAFRHPNGSEAQVLMHFILFKLRGEARKAGIKFCRRPYVSFVYGYEVARWGGSMARWVLPGTGAMPVHHTKVDSAGMNRIFKAVTDGPYPLAIAPEGQVSYSTESVPRLEQGTVRIGFQVAERLKKQGKDCPVEILPLSTHYRFGSGGVRSLNKLIKKIEKYTGMEDDSAEFTERLRRSRDYILEKNEKRYGITAEKDQTFNERIDILMEAALSRAERILGIRAKSSDLVDRMYHIRQVSWDRMVIPDVTSLDHLTLLERGILDLNSGEAWHASRHMELVDFVWYFRVPIPSGDAPIHVRIEYAQNLWDFINRTLGGTFSIRIMNVHPRELLIQAAPVINLTSRLNDYKENKKDAIAAAMNDMEKAYLDCIDRAAEYQI